jgi:glycosyltransferase involved in cell wall biosynthesis
MDCRKRLAFFDFNINFGGAPKGTLALAENLQANGESVFIFDAFGANSDYLAQIEEFRLPSRILVPKPKRTFLGSNTFVKGLQFLLQLPLLVRVTIRLRANFIEHGCNFVWVNNVKSLLFVGLARGRRPIDICFYHRGWSLPSQTPFYESLIVKFFRPQLCAHSISTVRNLRGLYPSLPVKYIPNSVTLKEGDHSILKRLKNHFYIILPAARPVREKGHLEAIEALANLKTECTYKLKLLITGVIPTGDDGSFYSRLLERVDELGLNDNVEFVGWIPNLAPLISQCDLTILPSYTEGFPRVVIESMLVGTPVIATPVGGIPEAIVDEVTGRIVPVCNPLQLSKVILEVIEMDNEARETLIENARIKAKANFSAEEQLSKFKEIIYGKD